MTHYDNQSETLTIECDECGADGVFRGSFKETITECKAAGWIIRPEEVRPTPSRSPCGDEERARNTQKRSYAERHAMGFIITTRRV